MIFALIVDSEKVANMKTCNLVSEKYLFKCTICWVSYAFRGKHDEEKNEIKMIISGKTWKNVTTNQSDFKELVPQFYQSGDFLSNSLGIDFGSRQVITATPPNYLLTLKMAKIGSHRDLNKKAFNLFFTIVFTLLINTFII